MKETVNHMRAKLYVSCSLVGVASGVHEAAGGVRTKAVVPVMRTVEDISVCGRIRELL